MPRRKATTTVVEEPVLKAGDRDVKFVLSDGSRPVQFKFSSQQMFTDPSTGRKRTARYIEGIPTFWKDEQPSDVRRTTIWMIDGDLIVNRDNIALQDFLLTYIENEGENAIIKVDDPEADSRKKNAVERNIAKAKSLVFDKSESDSGMEELNMIARYHSIPVGAIPNESVIEQLINIAGDENRVNDFLKSFDNPTVKMKALMIRGVEKDLFDLSNDREVRDASTGNVICAVPIGTEAIDALTSHALTAEGKAVVEYVESYV